MSKNETRNKKIRNLLREKFGKRCYRIRKNGTVDVYGQMPNSTVMGWWYYGSIDQAYERLTSGF
jgi:hypothetical protein